MGVADGTPTALTYNSTIALWPQGAMLRDRCADFNGTTAKMNIGSLSDIDNLVELSLSLWVYPRSAGGGSSGKFLWKGSETRFECNAISGSKVGLYARIQYSTTHAESNKLAVLDINAWSHVCFTYSQAGDRKIHIFVNGAEVTAYDSQIASVGTRLPDAASDAWVGNLSDGSRGYDGFMTTMLLHTPAISPTGLLWLSMMNHYRSPGGYLKASAWEKHFMVNTAKLPHGAVVFDLEDSYDTHYTVAKPIFDANHVQGTLGTLVSAIDSPGRLTTAQLKQFVADGWEIASHSLDHSDPLLWNDTELLRQLTLSKSQLEATFNVPVNTWSWPPNQATAAQRVTALKHYTACIGSAEVSLWNNQASLPFYNLGSKTLGEAETLVDSACSNGHLLLFGLHECTGGAPALLTSLLPYIIAKGMPILTLAALMTKTVNGPGTPILNGMSIRMLNVHGSLPQYFFKLESFPVGKSLVWFHAYTDGTMVSAEDVVPWVGNDTITNLCTNFTYIRVGPGIYLCCADYLETLSVPRIFGLQVPVLIHPKPPYVTYPQHMAYP